MTREPERGRRIPISPAPSKPERPNWIGGPLIVAASLAAVVLLVLAVLYAVSPRSSGASSSGGADAKLTALSHRYLAVAGSANRRLGTENDGYAKNEHTNLAAARADLRAEVATESRFDRQLAAISFPPKIAAIARALIAANQRRGSFTVRQARSATLARMRSFDARHKATDAAVEVQVRLIRKALHLPPPHTG